MDGGLPPRVPRSQAGFSMVEMLITAFVLAIGLLGLAMLQTLSLRAGRGGRSMTTAVQIAERVMDTVEMEGRLSWLNVTDSNASAPSRATDLPNLIYIPISVTGNHIDYYDPSGVVTTQAHAFYTATTTRTALVAGTTGLQSDFMVVVTFSDAVGTGNKLILRTASLSRRVLHG